MKEFIDYAELHGRIPDDIIKSVLEKNGLDMS